MTVLCFDGGSLDRAQGLSDRLDAPVAVCEAGCSEAAFIPEPGLLYLKVSRDGLSLMRDGMELRPDFAEMLPRIKQGALQREMLVKAARVKGVEAPRAVDATAGLGEDSLLLAAAGFTVTLCEADPVIAALLEDALARASAHEVLGPIVERARSRRQPHHPRAGRASTGAQPDVVYLDPVAPAHQDAAARKFPAIHGLSARPSPRRESLPRPRARVRAKS
ncbi:MAG: class I SAM-dependent methyltransferase [Collinsella intestinalis]